MLKSQVLRKRNYAAYKDGLPVVNLTNSKFKAIGKGVCVVAVLQNGKKMKVRVRLKPVKKWTLAQENARLKRELAKLQNEKGEQK